MIVQWFIQLKGPFAAMGSIHGVSIWEQTGCSNTITKTNVDFNARELRKR